MSLYLDASALVKLVAREPETDALRHILAGPLVTSSLSRVEVVRAVLRRPGVSDADLGAARRLLAATFQVPLRSSLLDTAALLAPGTVLRSLDAVHIASALRVGERLRAFVTYDRRLADAAAAAGLTVIAPG